jgi:two-component system LytT family response regulator
MSKAAPFTALIIDDETRGRNSLKTLIQNYVEDLQIVSEAAAVKSGIIEINKHKPSIVFLDIEMPEQNGFALYDTFPEPDFHVIFVTAYDQYMVKALRHAALDYLLKPIDVDELIAAVNRARKKNTRIFKKQLEILDNVLSKNDFKKITLPTKDGLLFVETSEIIRCEADGSYTNFYLKNKKKIMVSSLLGTYEKILSEDFMRVHASHIVNLNHITNYIKGRGGTIILSDNSKVALSSRKKEAFLKRVYHKNNL